MSAEKSEATNSFGIPHAEPTPTPLWASGNAKKEELEWDELDQVKKNNDVLWLKDYGKILIYLTRTFAAIFIWALLVWTWHQIGPADFWGMKTQWLNQEQLSKIQSILFSGGMGAVISGIVRTQVNKTR